jgi:hypothetical protein
MEAGIVGTSKSTERLGKTDAYDIVSRRTPTRSTSTRRTRVAGWICRTRRGPTCRRARQDQDARRSDLAVRDAGRGRAEPCEGRHHPRRGAARRAPAPARTALPAGQKIAEGGTGLTMAKLLATKEILDAAELDDENAGRRPGRPNRVSGVLGQAADQPARHDRNQVDRLQQREGAGAGHGRHVPGLQVHPHRAVGEVGHHAVLRDVGPRLRRLGRRQGHSHQRSTRCPGRTTPCRSTHASRSVRFASKTRASSRSVASSNGLAARRQPGARCSHQG